MSEELAIKIALWVALIGLLTMFVCLAVLLVYEVIHVIMHGSFIS